MVEHKISIVIVTNKKTGYEGTFTHITAHEAVVCAYEQEENKNYITWEYDYTKASFDGFIVSCGDYKSHINGEKIK